MLLTKSKITIANILNEAGKLFIDRNYADVTMDQIAEASGLTKGAVYHHFTSKEELYLEMMHANLSECKELFNKALDSPGSCRDKLRKLTKSFFDLHVQKRELMRLVRRDINIFPEPHRSALVKAYQESLPAPIEAIINRGIQDGEIKDVSARLLSWHFVALVEVALAQYATDLLGDTDAKLDYLMDIFLNGAAGTNGVAK